jgi:hypothetical protein
LHRYAAIYPDQVAQTGKAEMRARYQLRFSNPNLHAEIIKRIALLSGSRS